MSELVRCPHCKAALPEEAAFCARCGRRIEGWTVPKDATPAMGESALPGGDEATRQMDPTPSLLRAAAISVKKGGGRRRQPRSHLPLVLAMIVVAVAGGIGGFFIVRARVRRSPSIVAASPIAAPEPALPPLVRAPLVAPSGAPASAPPANMPPKMIVRKSKTGKRAHVIASAPVAVKARATKSGGLPHKQVDTDSRPMTLPTVQHETTSESPPPPPTAAE